VERVYCIAKTNLYICFIINAYIYVCIDMVTTQHKMRSCFIGVADGVITEVVTIFVVVVGEEAVPASLLICLI
jgi:hypothetical protein